MTVPTPDPSPEPGPTRLSAAQLLPVVYEELRRLATARLARERNLEPMRPTSLVHATWLRLIGDAAQEQAAWDGRGHFFAAAALAMRRILVERARQRDQLRRGTGWTRLTAETLDTVAAQAEDADPTDLIALDAALTEFEQAAPDMHRVVMLRYFGGLSIPDTADVLGISPRTVKRRWQVARLWLLERMDRTSATDTHPA